MDLTVHSFSWKKKEWDVSVIFDLCTALVKTFSRYIKVSLWNGHVSCSSPRTDFIPIHSSVCVPWLPELHDQQGIFPKFACYLYANLWRSRRIDGRCSSQGFTRRNQGNPQIDTTHRVEFGSGFGGWFIIIGYPCSKPARLFTKTTARKTNRRACLIPRNRSLMTCRALWIASFIAK